jgi:hypothetical protein
MPLKPRKIGQVDFKTVKRAIMPKTGKNDLKRFYAFLGFFA